MRQLRSNRLVCLVAPLLVGSIGCVADPSGDAPGARGDDLGTGACVVAYELSTQWNNGFVAQVVLTNETGAAYHGWKLEWTFPSGQTITSLWNGVASQNGGFVTVANASYDGDVPAGGSVQLGFVGAYSGQNAAPTSFSVNGVRCTGSGGGSSSSASSSGVGASSSSSSGAGGASSSSSSSSGATGSSSSSASSTGSTSSSSSSSSSSGSGPGTGWLHTSGSKIVDAAGHTVRITGINWFGMETSNYAPHGLWSRSLGSMLDQVKALGYNTLRLPYASQLFDAGSTPNGIDFGQNPTLSGLTGLEVMDQVIAAAGARGLKVILDRHRPDSGGQSALWYTAQYSEQRWIDDWTKLAKRYASNPTVIGADLHNEPHAPAAWGNGDPATDWRLAAQKAGNAILAQNPHLLVIVEGVDQADGAGYWWGGNLKAAGAQPVTLSVPNQLVYSTHDYPSTVSAQPWFSDPSYPANLPSIWDDRWGYLVKNGIAPVLVGEWGTLDQTTSDQQWFAALAKYIHDNGLSFTYWCLNPNSGDTGGILNNDWATVNQTKQAVIQPLLAPLLP